MMTQWYRKLKIFSPDGSLTQRLDNTPILNETKSYNYNLVTLYQGKSC